MSFNPTSFSISKSEYTVGKSNIRLTYDITDTSPQTLLEPKLFSRKFMLSYYFLILLCFINALTHFLYYQKSIIVLLVGIIGLLICMFFSLIVIFTKYVSKYWKTLMTTLLYILTALYIIFSDTGIFSRFVGGERKHAFISGLYSLTFLATIAPNQLV